MARPGFFDKNKEILLLQKVFRIENNNILRFVWNWISMRNSQSHTTHRRENGVHLYKMA